jgi:arabinofuranan 3-O-arabinosyltransferase
VAFTGDRDAAGLTDDLRHGAPLILTDTNRRRLRVVLAYEADYSHTLAPGQALDRPTQSLWNTEGSQSVAWFPDVESVSLTGPPRSVGGSLNWNRPANAFDGDPTTGWALRAQEEPVGRVLGLQLRRPTEVGSARVTLLAGVPQGITRGRLRFSDGSEVPVELAGDETAVTFPARTTERVEFVVDAVAPGVATVGIAELALPGIDVTEYIQVPDDVSRRAAADEALAAAVRAAPAGYAFSRSVQTSSQTNPLPALVGAVTTTDEETSIRRRFPTVGDREVDVGGRLRLRPDTPDEIIDRLIGGDHGAVASARHNGALEGIGARAVDGDPATAWLAPAQADVTVTLRFPRQEVRFVDLSSQYDGASSKIDRFRVETSTDPADPARVVVHPAAAAAGPVTGTNGEVRPSDAACDRSPKPPPGCVRTGRLTLDRPVVTDHLTVRITGVSGREAAAGGRIRVDELAVNGAANRPLFRADARPAPCIPLGVRLDGPGGVAAGPAAVAMTVDGTTDDLLRGRTVRATGCGRLRLADGWHLLDSGAHAPFDELHLLEPAVGERLRAAPDAVAPVLTVGDRAPTELDLRIGDNRPGSVLLFNESYDGGWRAFANGVPLGRPRDLNGMNGWVLDQGGSLDIEVRYNPRSLFGYSLPVTGLALALCGYLALRRPRSERRDAEYALRMGGRGG